MTSSSDSAAAAAATSAAPNSAVARDEPVLGVRTLPPRRRDRGAGVQGLGELLVVVVAVVVAAVQKNL